MIQSIKNAEIKCHQEYTQVTEALGEELDSVLKGIESFFYSDFWEYRFKRRLKEEGIKYNSTLLDIIQGTISILKEETIFKLFSEDTSQKGRSNYTDMIALNSHISHRDSTESHLENVIMHEFGHRQYNLPEFKIIIKLNDIIFKDPRDYVIDKLSEKDFKYFTNHNELRLRIIPIIKEMYDNKWNPHEAYNYSPNLNTDDIKDIYTKKYIIYLLENIL